MRIRQIRFDRWGSLSGDITLEPDRLALLVVDTDRERADLVAAFEAVLAEAPAERAGGTGQLLAELELDPREAMNPLDPVTHDAPVTRYRQLGSKPIDAERAAPLTRVEVLAARRARPWLIDGEDLAGYTDLADLVTWVRVWADSTAGYRSAEDVRMVLDSGLMAYPGMLVDSEPVTDELARLEQALDCIAAEAGGLEEDRRQAAVALAGLAQARRQIAAVETPLVALERQEVRSRYGQLREQIDSHRKAHARFKALSREAASLAEMARFPAPAEVDATEALMSAWQTGRARMEQLDEAIADLKAALERCAQAARKRGWAKGTFPDTAVRLESLVGRYQRVAEKLGAQNAICEQELARPDVDGASVAEYAALDDRVREVPAEDRDFVLQSFPSVLDQFFRFVSMATGLKHSQNRLGTVRSLEIRITVAAVLFIVFGLTAASGVLYQSYYDREVPEGPYLIVGGVFLTFLGSGLIWSAGGLLSKRRGTLEAQVAGMVMPIELEGLRLSVIELKMEEICTKFGYGCGEDMARDLARYADLSSRDFTAPWQQARHELRRIRSAEVQPLSEEATALLRSYPFPATRAPDALAGVVQVWNELCTWLAGEKVDARLRDGLRRTQGERDRLAPVQERRLADLRRQLADAGVKADPGAQPAEALSELRTRRRRYERWVGVRTREVPRVQPLLMRPAELAKALRELRAVTRRIGREETGDPFASPALTPAESQLARKLTVARRRLAMLRERERTLAADARARLTSYHRRLPALLERRRRLLAARERAQVFRRAIQHSLAELDHVTRMVRPGIARLLNQEGLPRWTKFRPSLEGVSFEPDLALSIPFGSDRQNAYDARLAHLAVRAALAGHSGPGGLECPLVLVEPFEKADPQELGTFVNYLVNHIGPRPQVVIVTRRRSKYERVRWEQPLVFKKIQIIDLKA